MLGNVVQIPFAFVVASFVLLSRSSMIFMFFTVFTHRRLISCRVISNKSLSSISQQKISFCNFQAVAEQEVLHPLWVSDLGHRQLLLWGLMLRWAAWGGGGGVRGILLRLPGRRVHWQTLDGLGHKFFWGWGEEKWQLLIIQFVLSSWKMEASWRLKLRKQWSQPMPRSVPHPSAPAPAISARAPARGFLAQLMEVASLDPGSLCLWPSFPSSSVLISCSDPVLNPCSAFQV